MLDELGFAEHFPFQLFLETMEHVSGSLHVIRKWHAPDTNWEMAYRSFTILRTISNGACVPLRRIRAVGGRTRLCWGRGAIWSAGGLVGTHSGDCTWA